MRSPWPQPDSSLSVSRTEGPHVTFLSPTDPPRFRRRFHVRHDHCSARAASRACDASPDALIADPSHYTVLFENAEVRVLRIRYGPKDKGQMHNHPRSITVFLTDGNFRVTAPDGQTRVVANKAGDTTMEGGAHLPENLSDQPFEAIRIEMKTAPIGPWTPAPAR